MTGQNDPNPFQPNVEFLNWFSQVALGIGRIYHDFEVSGFEKIPKDRGALLVFYHGLVPIDFWLLGMALFEHFGKPPCALVDRFLLKTPGLAWLTKNVGGVVGERATAIQLLKQGVIVGVSPGGVKEAISGTRSNYRLVWGHRIGFAELALQANVPIIPGFTENVEEMYRAPLAGKDFFQKIYEWTRLPLVPIFGLGPLPFPVKLTTHLGDPIVPKPAETAEELAHRTKVALQQLIDRHQPPNATVLKALQKRLGSITFGRRKPL